ncbi:unnamed protein product [Cylicocyclus nassatus]|uniref:Uncharacterized protein n=1 Tax=Cylicocyclus nassatus TaxID=53992 RepID=A0AA36GWE3_CYLNA|nr:unnamed protein product [Cylicocyclus nassatus]
MKIARETYYREYLRYRTFIGVICLCITFAFLSGQMWNHIRRPPLNVFNQHTRETKYIHRSPRRQYLGESYVVFASYAAITIGFILINEFLPSNTVQRKAKKKISAPKWSFYVNKNTLLVYFGLVMSVAFFLLMSSMLCSKNRKYSYCVGSF